MAAAVALTLHAVATRGENRVPPEPVVLRLERTAAAPPASAAVRVRTVEGQEVWSGNGVAQSDAALLVTIPAGRLVPGDYIVKNDEQRWFFGVRSR
ncbi:MAG TPA: hypothetical protein VJS92_12485 [Candidatus Polarisedimenticolaceae bacterium]|nr:hypothetical protein [Candidatus Polarisedimenticolaceae bacterium]